MSVCLFVFLSISLSVYRQQFVYFSICLFVNFSDCLCFSLSICIFVYFSVFLFDFHLSVYFSTCLFFQCLSDYRSIWIFFLLNPSILCRLYAPKSMFICLFLLSPYLFHLFVAWSPFSMFCLSVCLSVYFLFISISKVVYLFCLLPLTVLCLSIYCLSIYLFSITICLSFFNQDI